VNVKKDLPVLIVTSVLPVILATHMKKAELAKSVHVTVELTLQTQMHAMQEPENA
jgi:hypothetical protein